MLLSAATGQLCLSRTDTDASTHACLRAATAACWTPLQDLTASHLQSRGPLCMHRIIGSALGVGGTLLGLVPYLTRGEVRRCLAPPKKCPYSNFPAIIFLAQRARAPPSRPCASAPPRAAVCLPPCACVPPAASQRKRILGDRWTEAMYDRDKAIKKQFAS